MKSILCLILVLVIIEITFLMPMLAHTTTWYVSPTGDDANDGTEISPYRTIQHAVDQAAAGDIIEVMDDDIESTADYIENIAVNKKLTIERYNDTGANPQVMASNSNSHIFSISASYVTIRGLDIYGATGPSVAGIYLASGVQNCTIENNRCGWDSTHNNYYGIYLYSSSNNTVSGNTCSNSNDHGIYLRSSSNNTLSNNTCSSNSKGILLWSSSNNIVLDNTCNSNLTGILLYESSSSNTLSGNVCNSNNSFGIDAYDSSNSTIISGNTCNSNSNDFGIRLRSSSNSTVSGNTCNSNSGGISCSYSNPTITNNTITGNYGSK